MMKSHIRAIERSLNPPERWTYSRLDECQSPVKYGMMMKIASGIISSAPVT